jgi:hypothetical protein
MQKKKIFVDGDGGDDVMTPKVDFKHVQRIRKNSTCMCV